MESKKDIEWALTAPIIDTGPALENLVIPEASGDYALGYRNGLLDAREFFAKKQHPLLQCVECKNTESTAGAMARAFNQGRCVHCGGYFKVVKA